MKSKKHAALGAFIFLWGWIIPVSVVAGPPDNYTATLIVEGMSMSIAKMGDKDLRINNLNTSDQFWKY
jgi:hypothetical protein